MIFVIWDIYDEIQIWRDFKLCRQFPGTTSIDQLWLGGPVSQLFGNMETCFDTSSFQGHRTNPAPRRFGEHDHSGLQRVISENSQLNRIHSGGEFNRQVSVEGQGDLPCALLCDGHIEVKNHKEISLTIRLHMGIMGRATALCFWKLPDVFSAAQWMARRQADSVPPWCASDMCWQCWLLEISAA